MTLQLARGRKIKVAMAFEAPNDETIAMTADEDVRVAAAEGLMDHEVTDELLDENMGMSCMPMAQITIMRKDASVESSVFMTKDELRRHIFEEKAILKAMDEAAALVDRELRVYIRGLRKKVST